MIEEKTENKIEKKSLLIGGCIMALLAAISVSILFGLGIVSCGKTNSENIRTDETKNEALEGFCKASILSLLIEKDLVQVAREYVCYCQQGAVKSDQNLCAKVISHTHQLNVQKICGEKKECMEIFLKTY